MNARADADVLAGDSTLGTAAAVHAITARLGRWPHHHLRKVALEAAVVPGPAARALLARIEGAPARTLPRLGAELYRTQRPGAAITPAEWRRVCGA